MAKPKRKLTARQKAEKKRLRQEYMTVFIGGKQKRVRRPPTIDGISVEEFVRNNADALWYHQNEMWDEIELGEEIIPDEELIPHEDMVPDEEMIPDEETMLDEEMMTDCISGETGRSTLIEAEHRDGVRVLRLCRPPVNALNLELAQALRRAVAEARASAECTGVVLTGLPGVFSAGIDTREVPAYDAEKRAAMLRTINRTVLGLYGLAKPVVAAVSGHALGGAFVLMLGCDVRLVARGPFRLGLTEAGAGIPFPAGPLAVVHAELAPAQLRTLALGSLTAGPESEAFVGIIDRVVEPADLLEAALGEVRRLSALPAYGRVKEQLRAATIERLTQIVERDEEPLLAHWV